MCDTCTSINLKIDAAQNEGNTEKERVMRVLLKNHIKNDHSQMAPIQEEKRNVHPVCFCSSCTIYNPSPNAAEISQTLIVWPNGTRWEIKRG